MMANDNMKIPAGPYEIDPGDSGDDSVGLGPTPASIVDRDGNDLCLLQVVYKPYPEDHDPFEDGGYQGEIIGHWSLFKNSPEMCEIVRLAAELHENGWTDTKVRRHLEDAARLWAKMKEEVGDGE